MGLNMTLYRWVFIGNNFKENKDEMLTLTIPDSVQEEVKAIRSERIVTIEEEVIHWRKANAIHAWFERQLTNGAGIESGREYHVPNSTLVSLRDTCKEVLDACELVDGNVMHSFFLEKDSKGNIVKTPQWEKGQYIKNPHVAMKLLPTQEGFFFGSTQYDQWYFEDIKHTYKELCNLLADDEKRKIQPNYYYASAW